jgi:hypothetical protein
MTRQLFLACVAFFIGGEVSASGVIRDGNDIVVGAYADESFVHTIRGFRASFEFSSGEVVQGDGRDIGGAEYRHQLLYLSGDCSGQAYLIAPNNGKTPVGGVVVRSVLPYELFYVPKSPALAERMILSERNSTTGICFVDGGTVGIRRTVPANPNDPSVTGIGSTPAQPPLRLEMEPLSVMFDLFEDGFEGALVARDAAVLS